MDQRKEIKDAKAHILLAIKHKIVHIEMKSKIITVDPLVINYQGKIYKIEVEDGVDTFFVKTYTENMDSVLTDQVMLVLNRETYQEEIRVFTSDRFIPLESDIAGHTTAYNYSIERYMLEWATKLYLKNMHYCKCPDS